jgi:hypothetical protein
MLRNLCATFCSISSNSQQYIPDRTLFQYWQFLAGAFAKEGEIRPPLFFVDEYYNYYCVSASLQRWLYQRCLQLAFFNLLDINLKVFAVNQADYHEPHRTEQAGDAGWPLKNHLEDELSFHLLPGNQLKICYVRDPLERVPVFENAQTITRQCLKYRHFLISTPNYFPYKPFSERVYKYGLTHEQYQYFCGTTRDIYYPVY